MRYRRFGRTELQMPVLTCGGMRYQHSWSDLAEAEIPSEGQKNLEDTVQRAFALGINHIETARGYGTSELQLGRILPSLPRDRLILQTKVGPVADADEFRRTFERSLKLLRVDYVDLLSLHGINHRQALDWSLRKGGCLDMAWKLKERGLARHIGFSTHATLEIILEALKAGFEYINLHYYFVNQTTWPAVREAARQDMGVFIISPNDKGGKLYVPPPKMVELCRPLSPMQFNDLFCLSSPEVHTLSIGAARPSDFDAHVDALAHYDAIADTISPIVARLEHALIEAVGKDWYEHWQDGIPEHTDLPEQINVREIVRLYTYAKGLDLIEWGKFRYNLLGRGDDWFPGTNSAHFDEAALRKLLAQSPFPDRVIAALHEAHTLLVGEEVKRLSKS